MNINQFVECVNRNAIRIHEYKLGHDGSDGTSDCIGLIIGAVRIAGMAWTGTHGSNYAARNEMKTLERFAVASALDVGDIVYKAKAPAEQGYALPDKYKSSPDQNDYYHVGVVTSVSPLVITHCTGVEGGIKKDSKVGQWKYHGKLKKCSDDTTPYVPIPAGSAKVNASAVAVREGCSTSCPIITRLPSGTVVELTDVPDGWTPVRVNGKTGFMMSKFLEKGGQA